MTRPLGALALALLAGCLQYEQTATLMPDHSGKIHMTVAFKKTTLKVMEAMARTAGGEEKPDLFAEFTDPVKLQENSEGVSAWSEPWREEEGEWVRVTVTGYFADVNKVRIYDVKKKPVQEKKLAFACKVEKTDKGHALVFQNDAGDELKNLGAGADPNDLSGQLGQAMIQMMKPMLEGMKFCLSITVPGPIEEVTGGLEKKGRTASTSLEGQTVFAALTHPEGEEAKRLKTVGEHKETRITWGENTVTGDEVRAFKSEMEAVLKTWQKRLDEAKQKAAKPPPEKEKDF